MPTDLSAIAHLVGPETIETVSVFGPTIEFLTPAGEDDAPCVMRGTIPPGAVVPLHSHPEPETFIALSGEVEGLAALPSGFEWLPVQPGDVFHVPGGARHAWRNLSRNPATNIVVTAQTLGRFFREVGTPHVIGKPPPMPSRQAIEHFLATAERYGHWTASPDENAEVGLTLPPVQ
jgi:quercetin dioxygenase-like cupin family protein